MMKSITFKETASNKIYADYIKRVKRMTKRLPSEDQQDILMEFNSHIFESMQLETSNSEIEQLLDVIESLGQPEEVLLQTVASKKLDQATKTFNPIHVFKAIVLNISNGIAYTFFAILYILLFGFVFVIGAKIVNPEEVGLFFKSGSLFVLGSIDEASRQDPAVTELLGNLFVPVMIAISVGLYFLITLLLRLKRKKN